MAITLIDIDDSPGARSASIDSDWNRSWKTAFTVVSNSSAEDAGFVRDNLVYGSVAIKIGTAYPGNVQARCTGITASMVAKTTNGAGSLWRVDVEWGPWNPIERTADENPLNVPIVPTVEPVLSEAVAEVDKDGNPLVNTAGDYFDPPILSDETRYLIRAEQNLATLPIPGYFAYGGYINNATWQGFPAYTVKYMPPRMSMPYSQYLASNYYAFAHEFIYKPDNWLEKVVNQGFRQLDASGKFADILVNGQPCSTPMLLDSAGHVLVPPITSSNVVIRTFHKLQEADFNTVFASFPSNIFATHTLV